MDPAALHTRIDAVAIGASAGGVEALSILLPALRPTCRAAVFVVVHVPRDRPSLLAEIFAAKCMVPVREAEDKERVEPGTVYFAPPDYHLLIERGGYLALSTDELVHYSRPSIDVLFESTADAYGERTLGVILTGANQDGAHGLHAIRKAGGLTVVQTPDSAQAQAMPLAALKYGPPDFVLPLQQMSWLLSKLNGPDGK